VVSVRKDLHLLSYCLRKKRANRNFSLKSNVLDGEYVLERFPTGIETLDELIEGGFPRPSAIGIIGDVGAGKSLLCWQIMWNALERGSNVLFYLTEESKDEMKESVLGYGWDIDAYEKKGKLKIVDIFSKGVDIAAENILEPEALMKKSFNFSQILKEGRDYYFHALRGADLLVIFNSISTIFLTMETKNALAFLQNLKLATRVGRCVGIATLHRGIHDEKIENICRGNSDGIVEMRAIERDGKLTRRMRILKMSRTDFYREMCTYVTGKGGITFSRQIFE